MQTLTNIVLDLHKPNYVRVTAKQYNDKSRIINVQVTDYGNLITLPEDMLARVKWHKPDGKGVFNDCDIRDSVIYVELTAEMLAAAGTAMAEIILYQHDSVVSTMSFSVEIYKSVLQDRDIVSSDEFRALSNALISVNAWNGYFEETSGRIEEKYTERVNALENGKADLVNGLVPASQLPSFVDDVLEGTMADDLLVFYDTDGEAVIPESSKIYMDIATNKIYRWSGRTSYVIVSDSLALGETESTAYPGSKGKELGDKINLISDKINLLNESIDNFNSDSVTQVGNLSMATADLHYYIRSYFYNSITHEVTIVILCDGNRDSNSAVAILQIESLRPHSTQTGLCWITLAEGNEMHMGYGRIDTDGKIYQRITSGTINRIAIFIKYVI